MTRTEFYTAITRNGCLAQPLLPRALGRPLHLGSVRQNGQLAELVYTVTADHE